MKRLLTILLATALTLSMVACGTKKEEEVKKKQEIQKEEKTDEDKVTITEEDTEETISQTENDAVVETPQKEEVVETPKKEEVVETPKKETEEKVPQKEPENNTPQVEEPPVVEAPNYYFNDTNNTYDINAVSVKPRHVYWKDGFLYAECFVINGFAHSVYNIHVKTLSIANSSGPIASANFGALDGVTLAPYTHTLWTFRFSADCISAPNADLSRLIVKASTSNNY